MSSETKALDKTINVSEDIPSAQVVVGDDNDEGDEEGATPEGPQAAG